MYVLAYSPLVIKISINGKKIFIIQVLDPLALYVIKTLCYVFVLSSSADERSKPSGSS
jgi:hypothetical protein